MARGVPLTPEQLDAAAAAYARTGNYAAAGRAIDVSESVARRALLRRGESSRVDLHARALARGLRRGRRQLVAGLGRAGRFFDAADGREFAAVLGAVARATEALLALDERADRRRQARLTRAKTRAEVRVLDAKAAGLLPPDVTVTVTDPAAVDALFREHFGHPGAALPAGGPDGPAPPGGARDVAGEAPPVPARLGP